jgi:carbon storage regulator
MLIISRKSGESFFIGDDIEITICDIQSDKIRIGITAPADISICRKEIKEIKDENVLASSSVNLDKMKNLNKFLNKTKNIRG